MSLLYAIDDDESMLVLYRALFSRRGYRVESFTSAEAAIAAFDDRRPDVMITDLEMPGLSGLELISQIRAREGGDAVPVLLVSSEVHEILIPGAMPGVADGLQIEAVLPKSAARRLPRVVERLLESR